MDWNRIISLAIGVILGYILIELFKLMYKWLVRFVWWLIEISEE